MGKDIVFPRKSFSKEAVTKIDDIYNALRKWARLYKYGIQEGSYKETQTEGKNISTEFSLDKKINDYTKYVITCNLSFSNIKTVKIKDKAKTKATVKFNILAYVDKDYEEGWSSHPLSTFSREWFDRFIFGDKTKKQEASLVDDANSLFAEIKAFLKIHEFRP